MNNITNYIDVSVIILLIISVITILYLISNFFYTSIIKNVNKIKIQKSDNSEIKIPTTELSIIRIFDVTCSLMLYLFVFTWLFPLIAILIKISSAGPVFYKSPKIGLNGKIIYVYKFRTMKINEHGEVDFPSKTEPYMTSIGKFLRKTGLDMFPAIINVIIGDMSFIGRSNILNDNNLRNNLSLNEVECLLKIKPGIISLYNISKDAIEFNSNDVAKFDLYYAKNISLGLYLKILFSSIIVSFGIISGY